MKNIVIFILFIVVLLIINVSTLWISEDGMFYDKELDTLIPYCNPLGGKWNVTLNLCLCYGHYSGSRCEYVSKCLHGQLMNGVCDCAYGWEGDLCNRIKCFHGKAVTSNRCICDNNFGGMYCDSCKDRNTNGPPDCITNSFDNDDYDDIDESKFRMTYFYLFLLRFLVCFGVFMCFVILKQTIILLKQRYTERRTDDHLDNISVISERAILKRKAEEVDGVKFPPTYEESEKNNLIDGEKNIYKIPDGVGPPSYDESMYI
uniref:EGF-like domain-containing protein n=1 Tax=Strongyloides papillosus TaxID=174720 RepID=A0A0N5C929_STREA